MRLVVGHRAGRPERYDGPVVGPEPRALHRVAYALLDARLPHLGSARRLAPHPRQGLARDGRQDLRRLAVAHQLRRRPPRREAGHERRGRHQPRPERFDQLKPAVGPESAERLRERGEIEAVEQRHQSCRGSGGAARHSHASPPVARQEMWSIAPSTPTRSRSSSVNPAPYSAHAAPSGVACTARASPTRATGTWLSRRSSPEKTARAARRAATYARARGPARAASRVSTKRRRTARRAARRPASANTRSASGRRPTSRSSASTCDRSAAASRRTMPSYSRSCIATVAERPSRLDSSSSANSDNPSSTGVSRFLTASRTARGTMLWTTARET